MERIIKISKDALFEEFLAHFCIGLLVNYKKGIVNYERIMLWIFNVKTINNLTDNKNSKKIIEVIEIGEELFGVEKTEHFEKTLQKMESLCLEIIKDSNKKTPRIGKEFIDFK